MAHFVYIDGRSRFEMNLPERPGFVVELLAWLGEHAEAAPACDCDCGLPLPVSAHPTPVAEPEAVQVSDLVEQYGPPVEEPEPDVLVAVPEPEPPARLLPRTCKRDGCSTVFQPDRSTAAYCSMTCRRAQVAADARTARAEAATAGELKCPECPRTFKTAQALGGHMNGHTGRQRGKAKPRQETPKPAPVTSARKALAPKSHPATPAGRKVPTAPPVAEPRPYRCKEEGCGHPCRSQGELDSHRRAYHDTRQGLPTTVAVLGALTFPCPEDGCDRVYDDENRLTHHRRVIHDYQAHEPVHEVVVHGHHGEKVG